MRGKVTSDVPSNKASRLGLSYLGKIYDHLTVVMRCRSQMRNAMELGPVTKALIVAYP